MKIKTSELIDNALDFAVAVALGHDMSRLEPGKPMAIGHEVWSPATNPAQGHPIIEREGISTIKQDPPADNWWAFSAQQLPGNGFGPTALVAAMRCFVASRLGDAVDVPEEMCK